MQTKTKIACVVGALAVLASGVLPLARAAQEPDPNKSPALCGKNDTPELGIQGDVAPEGGVNCGLTLISEVAGGGSVQGSGHCGYVRTGSVIKAYSLADPAHPVQTDEEATHGGSESMRAQTTDDRAILVSGKGVWDISNCEDMVFKGEIPWPSVLAIVGANIASTTQHELGMSHDARRAYTGLGFGIAYFDDLDHPETWTVKNHTCEMNRQSGFPVPGESEAISTPCDAAPQGEYPRQYSHSSDDNVEGTRWYGANQNGDGVSQLEPSTARVVDISDPNHITILDSLPEFPGHSMNWWRTADGREFIIGANESLSGPGDTCKDYPRPTGLGNAAEAYVAEVTGDEMKHASLVTVAINKPESCDAAKASGANATVTEHSVYNKNGAAFVMMEFGGAGLRVFDLRDGYAPKEAAYFNAGTGHVHSGVFHYDAARGIMLASGSSAMQVLQLQPQVIEALGLPQPTDASYPFAAAAAPGAGPDASLPATGVAWPVAAGVILVTAGLLARRLRARF